MHYSAFYGWGKKMREISTDGVKILDPPQSEKHLVMLYSIILLAFQRVFYSTTMNSGQKDLFYYVGQTSGQRD